MANIGEYIKSLREAKNYSQRKLGYLSGVSNATINRIESNTSFPNPETLKKLSVSLGVSYIELLDAAGYLKQKELFSDNFGSLRENRSTDYSDYSESDRSLERADRCEKSENAKSETAAGKFNCEDGLKDCKFLTHIKDQKLKQWIGQPVNMDYLVYAKKTSDLGIDPEFVLNEFIYRIFKSKRSKE